MQHPGEPHRQPGVAIAPQRRDLQSVRAMRGHRPGVRPRVIAQVSSRVQISHGRLHMHRAVHELQYEKRSLSSNVMTTAAMGVAPTLLIAKSTKHFHGTARRALLQVQPQKRPVLAILQPGKDLRGRAGSAPSLP